MRKSHGAAGQMFQKRIPPSPPMSLHAATESSVLCLDILRNFTMTVSSNISKIRLFSLLFYFFSLSFASVCALAGQCWAGKCMKVL